MGSARINWKILFGWILTAASVIALIAIRMKHGEERKAPSSNVGKTYDHGEKFPDQPLRPQQQERRLRPPSQNSNPTVIRLKDLVASGELVSVHEELQSLAENHQLADVGDLLKTWCREGGMELAQWSLALSSGNEPQLNLALNAEALSNPSEIIRELAASELENASGIRFADSAHARTWLASQPNR